MSTGILYAMADDGVNLPVIDVTNAAFAVGVSDAELAARSAQFVLEQAQRQEIPASLRDALAHSTLGRALMEASGTFLGGMSTYLIKLGPDNLGADANPIDRSIAATFPAFTSRLRLQDMARLLADGLCSTAADHQRPVCLTNIGGGAGADSWNALIYLHTEHPDLLLGRQVVIAVLDLDDRGPAFGVRAVDALRAPGAPLGGIDISLRHLYYDWAQTGQLRRVLYALRASEAACAISSEGGLFEYGSDQEIVANLEAIRAGTSADAFVVGSVTREGEAVRASHRATRISARPRTMEAFRSLVGQAGWLAQCVIERPFSYHVRLVKA
jgi:hypothetical protein